MSGIYLHIPFCRKACHYCDFHFSTSLKYRSELVAALVQEIEQRASTFKYPLETIYFGGGTPSVLNEVELNQIFSAIHANFDTSSVVEVTLEANPDDCSIGNLKLWETLGINRLSIGVQSFKAEDLEWMNRSHTADQAVQCLIDAQTVGFDHINLDLIYGLPHHTMADWKANVARAFEMPVNHISAYSLTVEPKTALDHFIKTKKSPPISEARSNEAFIYFQKAIEEEGWEHYEVSNYCKPGAYAKHNTNYWKQRPYLGIGPSAHSYDNNVRRWNVANNQKYIKSLNADEVYFEEEVLTPLDQFNERIMLGLRTKWGVNIQDLEDATRLTLDKDMVEDLQSRNLVEEHKGVLTLTKRGKSFADYVASELFIVEN